jgi:hypothetical protein
MSDESTASIDGQLYDFDMIARLDVTIKTVRRMIARGELGYHQVGRLRQRWSLRVLRVFDDPVNVERLINLPESMTRSLARLPVPRYNDAVRAQTALAIAIELVAPLRAKNLLRLDRHLIRRPNSDGTFKHWENSRTVVKTHRPVRPAVTIVTKACVCNYSLREPFFCCRFRSRTPGPPPFSSMNSRLTPTRGG